MALLARMEAAGQVHASLVSGIEHRNHWKWSPEARELLVFDWSVGAVQLEVEAASGPLLLTAGKLTWFPGRTLPDRSGWMSVEWKQLRLGATPLCVLSSSQGVLLCAAKGRKGSFQFVSSLVAVNPTTKRKLQLDVMALDLVKEEGYKVMDASLQTTALELATASSSVQATAVATAALELHLFLWVEKWEGSERRRRFLHAAYGGGDLPVESRGLQLCSVCPWTWTPDEETLFAGDTPARSNVANIAGRFYSLHWTYGGASDGLSEASTTIKFDLWECDFRFRGEKRSVWTSIPVAPLLFVGEALEEIVDDDSERRYFLIAWEGQPALVEVVMGQATSVDNEILRCGVKRISLMVLGHASSATGELRQWVPAPGFHVFDDHGDPTSRNLDAFPNLYRFGFAFAISNFCEPAEPHGLGVSVLSADGRIFCTLNVQDGINQHPPKVLVYQLQGSNVGTWLMASSSSSAVEDVVEDGGATADVAAQRFMLFDPSFVELL